MKIQRVWWDEDGEIVYSKDLELRVCLAENPVQIEIALTEDGVLPNESIFIDVEKLRKLINRGNK